MMWRGRSLWDDALGALGIDRIPMPIRLLIGGIAGIAIFARAEVVQLWNSWAPNAAPLANPVGDRIGMAFTAGVVLSVLVLVRWTGRD